MAKNIKKHFNSEWMQMMDFQTKEEFDNYLMEVIKEQTSDNERIKVLKYLNQFLDTKLS